MSKGWRRFRAVVTGVMSLVGIGIVVLAWLSAGTVPGEVAAYMGLIGLSLPVGFHVSLTLIGWQRSAVPGFAPAGLAGVCVRSQLGVVGPFLFGALLYGLINNANHALERHRGRLPTSAVTWSDTSDAAIIRQDCAAAFSRDVHASDAAHAEGAKYCGCIIRGLEQGYTDQELQTLPMHPIAAQDPRYARVAQQCRMADKP